jgi:hypothetical protein
MQMALRLLKYAMEAQLNAKELHHLNTVKFAGRAHVMEWYDGVGVYGSIWVVCVPHGFTLKRTGPWGVFGIRALLA